MNPAPGSFKKGGPAPQPQAPDKRLPRTQVVTMVKHGGKTLASRLIKPVGST